MALHKPFDRHFFTIGGAVKTEGGSLHLTQGQFGIFNMNRVTKEGATAVDTFAGLPKDTVLEMKLGIGEFPESKTPHVNEFSTFPFTLNDVLGVKANVLENKDSVDEVIVGYNGIDNSTTLTFEKGEQAMMVVELSGEPIGMLGYKDSRVEIPVYFDVAHCSPYADLCENCDPCTGLNCVPIVDYAVDTIKNFPLKGGVKVSSFVDVSAVTECVGQKEEGKTPYSYYTLTACDTGDNIAKAVVQKQYQNMKIERIDRVGAKSIYQVLLPDADGSPADFKVTLPSIMKGCETCPTGYQETKGGLVYAVTIEDDGEDMSESVATLPNVVEGTAQKIDGQDNGVGFYIVLLSKKLTDKEVKAFAETVPTATVDYVGKVKPMCTNDSVETIKWVKGETCKATTRDFILDLPDNECGEDRLEELQAYYPELTIVKEGTTGGCQTRYKTTVTTNIVCEECDPIFKESFKAEAPAPYGERKWKEEVVVADAEGCRCGIKIKGKKMEILPDECLIDEVGFLNSSTRIKVTGGYISETRFGDVQVDKPYHVEYITRASDSNGLGYNLKEWENRSYRFFSGTTRSTDKVAKWLKGEESHINLGATYIDYVVKIKRAPYYSQSFSGQENETINYHIMVENGTQQDIEALLNKLAVASGKTPVKTL